MCRRTALCRNFAGMKSFLHRLSRYLLGIAIGCLLLFMMFPDRDWLSWTPSKTLMRQINYFPAEWSDSLKTQVLRKPELAGHIARVKAFGRPDFSKSQTRTNPKVYLITDGSAELKVLIEADSLIEVRSVSLRSEPQ